MQHKVWYVTAALVAAIAAVYAVGDGIQPALTVIDFRIWRPK